MRPLLSTLAFGLIFLQSPTAEAGPCREGPCEGSFVLSSASDARVYGVLLAAPDAGCGRVRYRIETYSSGFLGQTPPLAPGEMAVVRVGTGFAAGSHPLRIRPQGCDRAPALTRRVTLHKIAPDHGWRAASLPAGQ